MGKRRERTRGSDHNEDDSSLLPPCSSSDAMPCSSGFVLSKKKKYPRLVEAKESKPPGASSSMEERSVKQLNAQMSAFHPRHNNLSQSVFLKKSRHGHQHPWRNSSNNFRASTSHGRSSANWDEIFFKLGEHNRPEDYDYAEARERMVGIPERIQSGPTISESNFPEVMRVACGICHKSLWKQGVVVGVLVCGHLYHADCLERKTPPEDKSDPPCPICSQRGEERETTNCNWRRFYQNVQ